jgi:hypothetical protein
MKSLVRLVVAAGLCLVAASTALAQLEQGRLTGIVTDAQGAILPGVTVTATSPGLIGTQVAVTEVDGRYLFPSLPSGAYVLAFELTGFQTARRENIILALGQTLNVNLSLQLATLQETVTVTAESPVVDTSSTRVGSEFSGEKLVGIPSATDLWAALAQAPGVRMTGFDVGGSHKSQQVGYESFGVRNQNKVVTDGVDTTEGTGGAGFYQDYFAHEEIAISAAGGDVTMSTPGSAVFSTIKSGGNEFKGLYNITYEGESFVGDNIDPATAERGYTGQPNLIFWEGHADLGGPVKRDKVWFYVAYNHFKIDKVISGVDPAVATDLGLFDTWTSKGTWKASQRDTLIGYYQWGRKQKPSRGLSVTVGPDSILAQDSRSWMYNGQHQRVWTNRFFTDLKMGLFGFGWPMVPSVDWQTQPPRVDLATDVRAGAGWNPFTFDRNKPQIAMTGTYFLPDVAGSHDLKFGYEYLNDQSKFGDNGNSGPIEYRDRDGLPSEIRLTDLGTFESFGNSWVGADDRNQWHALFFQDRWAITNQLTLTVGLRMDRQRAHYEPGQRDPVLTEIFAAAAVPGRTLVTNTNIAPRVGFSYALSQDNRSVIKTFYGRYYFNFADRLDGADPAGTNQNIYVFNDVDGNRLYSGVHELGTLLSQTGGSSTEVDSNLETPYTDQFNASYERQFWGEASFRMTYVRKMTRNNFATFNPARTGNFMVPVNRTIDIRDFGTGVTGAQTFTLYDVPPGLPTTNIVTNVPDLKEANYDTIQLGFNKRFAGGLFIQSSFDYQWRDELRQANSASTSPLNADPIGVGFYQNSAAYREVGNLQKSSNWTARTMGRYVFPWDVGVGVNLRVQSGWPYARRLQASLPNAGTVFFFAEPIDNNRSEVVPILDFRVDKAFRFADRYRITLMADLFNAMNSNSVTNFVLLNGTNFNRIVATLDPRTFMVGGRFDF